MQSSESDPRAPLNASEKSSVDHANWAAMGLLQVSIDRGQRLWESANQKPSKSPSRFERIMRAFFARALRDCRAVQLLWTAGFGPECWVIGRTLIELELQAALLQQEPAKYADAFFIHADMMRYQTAVRAQQLVDKGLTQVPSGFKFLDHSNPRIARLAKTYHDHKHEFIKNKKPERLWENWWKGSIANLAQRVRSDPKYGQSLYDEYQFGYANDSAYVHSSERVIVDVLAMDGNDFSIREPSLGSEPSVPFQIARRFLQMCIFFNSAFQLDFAAELEADWDACDEALRESDARLLQQKADMQVARG
jgi:Family of unknown function (DUF5677)